MNAGSRFAPPPADVIAANVGAALAEDIGPGDATASLLEDAADSAYLLCKEDCVVAGRPWFDAVHRALDPDVRIDWRCQEGDHVAKGTVIATLLDLIFRWLPFLIACFPVPGLKGKNK